jgi:OTT_1508-like deaminase
VDLSYSITRKVRLGQKETPIGLGEGMAKFLRLAGFVARVKTAYDTFLEAASQFPTICNIEIIRLDSPPNCPPVSAHLRVPFPKDLDLILAGLDRPDRHEAVAMKRKYHQLYAKKPTIHVEISMLFHLLRHGNDVHRVFPYIGISKKSCYLCGLFLANVGIFQTRGCHDVEYTRWTLPSRYTLNHRHGSKVVATLEKLENSLSKKNTTWKRKKLPREPESIAAVSYCSRGRDQQDGDSRLQSTTRRLDQETEDAWWEHYGSRT